MHVAANLIGRSWSAALAFLFIPVYLKVLGIEAYGLVGFFGTLQAVFGLLDLGLSVTINREIARLSALKRRQQQRDLLRTLELVYWAVSLCIGLAVTLLAPAIATTWVHAEHMSSESVTTAIRLMGVVIAVQFPWGFYQGGLMGIERQVFINGAMVVVGTLRSAGAVFVLWQLSPTVEAFFLWQAVVSIGQTAWFGLVLWRALPGDSAPRFVPAMLGAVWVFAATMTANALIGTVLTQLDKVLLSRLLTLEEFGYYALASSVGSIIWMVIVPMNQALFPRFARLLHIDDAVLLATVYHRSCQTLSVLVIPLAAVVVCFSFELIELWTHNSVTAERTSLIVQLLVVGTTLNGLASLAGQLQTAAGWPQLILYTNVASAVLLVPSMAVAVSRFGAVGAAMVWVVLNSGYILISIPLMHRRILRGELKRYYVDDLLMPASAAIAVTLGMRALGPAQLSGFFVIGYAGFTMLAAFSAAVAVSPLVRTAIGHLWSHWWLTDAAPRSS